MIKLSSYFLITCFLLMLTRCDMKNTSGDKSNTFRNKLLLTELDGSPIQPDQFDQKILILNLWATWCKPCIAEIPSLIKMEKKLPADKFELLLVSGEEVDKIYSFI